MAARVLRDKVFAASAVAFVVLSSLTLWQVAETERNVDTLNSDLDTTEQRLDTAQERGTVLKDAQAEAARQARALLRQVRRHGLDPVIDPGEINPPADTSPTIIEGEPGPPPSPEAVEAAVRRYCAVTDCQGPPGESVTPSEVAAAVALYCDARGECSGPTGPEGDPGDTGPAGPAPTADQIAQAVSDYCDARDACSGPPGDPGRPPTAEEIAAAVNDYCSTHDQCRGPKGDPGQNGQNGEDAFPFTFTFTVPADDPIEEDHTYRCTVTNPDAPVTCEET